MSDGAVPVVATQAGKFIDFHFDFISPYGYFASRQIESLAARHGRTVRWHPFHMRAVMKDMLGMTQAMADVPLKGAYVRKDVHRMARWLELPYAPAPTASFSSVTASRMLCLIQEADAFAGARFAHAVFHSHHALGRPPNSWTDAQALAAQSGVDAASLVEDEHGEHARDLFRQATADAVAKGVWGTPTFIVDGEMFWGCDRIVQLDEWLRHGGW
ncbi:2-hydroxychromene-2-carboxylate isomerase [Variovorax rhizosphaerae]|uniref:2-hydroxychromene-2-carboxylate isomerase n=1 Tax=Variovorax rhizosphaerae TaxID=1836200 RepID=A0ABU8WG12_9BURK